MNCALLLLLLLTGLKSGRGAAVTKWDNNCMGCLVENPKNYFCITTGKCVTTDTEIKTQCSKLGDKWTRDYMNCSPNFNCAVGNSTTESNPKLNFTSPFFNRILIDNRLSHENGTTIQQFKNYRVKPYDTCAILIANVIPLNVLGEDFFATFKVDASSFLNVTKTVALDWKMTLPSNETDFEAVEKSKTYFLEGAGTDYPTLKIANSQTYLYVMNNSTSNQTLTITYSTAATLHAWIGLWVLAFLL